MYLRAARAKRLLQRCPAATILSQLRASCTLQADGQHLAGTRSVHRVAHWDAGLLTVIHQYIDMIFSPSVKDASAPVGISIAPIHERPRIGLLRRAGALGGRECRREHTEQGPGAEVVGVLP